MTTEPIRRYLRGLGKALATFGAISLLLAPGVSLADTTTASIRGTVLGPNGAGDSGATIRIIDERTGSTRTATTGANGSFVSTGLRVGGPYKIVVDSARNADRTISDIYLSLGESYNFNIALSAQTIEEVVVTAQALNDAAVALGPSTSFSLNDLENAPAINRDIKDLIRIDPRVYIDEAFVDSVQCGGANPRFNSLTVDGVRMNDNFGLNSNGYPTERMPFSYDAIQQIAVELAPYDVHFGGFSACNINAVTKSGTNEFHGKVFYDYTDDGFQGDSLEGQPINLGSFDESRYGLSFGGPIIEDKLFFFIAAEKLDGAVVHDRGPAGSGAGREVAGVSVAQLDQIRQILLTNYNYDPGGLPTSSPVKDEKLLAKIDWNINDYHRLALIYTYNDGFTISESDGGNTQLEFSNHYYERGAELNSYVAQLQSDWTDNFSTEVRFSYSELDNRQLSLGGTDFGEFQITTLFDHDGDGINSRATIYAGADDSRHANKLKHDNTAFKASFTWGLGDHLISGGFEREELDIFNVFIQEAEGEFRFGSIANLEAGTPSLVIYENAAPSNVKEDAAAQFKYGINTAYIQDEYIFADLDLTVVGGLRYDWYTSDDLPRANGNFLNRYGYTNAQNFDGIGLLQPRVGFEWGATDNLSIHGGVGIFSGGNPNVWLSNNYNNDGQTQVEKTTTTLNGAPDTLFNIALTGSGAGPGYEVPLSLFNAVAAGTADSSVNNLDPNFDAPSSLKYSLGLLYYFEDAGSFLDGYVFSADFIYSKSRDSAIVRDKTLVEIATAPDGRPVYRAVDLSDPDCVTSPSNTATCSGRSQDFELTNAATDGYQQVLSAGFTKEYENGFSWSFGYAYTESEDVNPMTSSVAFSNYANISVSDSNNPQKATSNYEIPHRMTLKMQYEHAFFGDYMTRITLFGSRNKGIPYTYTFNNNIFGESVGFNRALMYVPDGPSDPNVVYGAGFNRQAFLDFVNNSGLGAYAGQIVPRNAFYSAWWTKFDLRIEQEFPGFRADDKASAFLVIENVGNMINDDFGVLYEAGFPRYQSIVDASINGSGQYVYNSFFQPGAQGRATDASLWELRFGVRYSF